MEDFWIGFGTLLALFGPLLLIPITWMVYRLVRRISRGQRRSPALLVAIVLVFGILATSYLPGRMAFDRLCREHGRPILIDSVSVTGFFKTHMFPYEATQYLNDGFSFVEAPDPYADNTLIRYSMGDDGNLVNQKIGALSSQYGVEERFETVRSGLLMTAKKVYRLDSGRVLGIAYDILYEGGPLSLFTGIYGMSSCPDPRTVSGSRQFQTFYDLEQRVLMRPLR